MSPFLYGEVSGCFVWCWLVNEKVEVWDTSYVEVRIWLEVHALGIAGRRGTAARPAVCDGKVDLKV